MVWHSRGLRVAVAGLAVVFIGAGTLVVSNVAATILMLIGGLAVMGGFISTLIAFYFEPTTDSPDE